MKEYFIGYGALLQQPFRFLRIIVAVSALEYAILVGVIAATAGAVLVAFTGDIDRAMNNTIGAKVVAGARSAETADLSP